MAERPEFKNELMPLIPALRAFARSLCNNVALADDLAQETLLRAWAHRDSFILGTNLRAWLFTIARNAFYSNARRRSREVEDPDGYYSNNLSVAPMQHNGLDLEDLQRGLSKLPPEQREAIMLIGASGCSYEEAASICGCAVGTIKSRVSRARRSLLAHLEGSEAAEGAPATDPSATGAAKESGSPERASSRTSEAGGRSGRSRGRFTAPAAHDKE